MLQRDGLEVRVLRISPLPEHWISATLFLPAARAQPLPGVLIAHGHGIGGRFGYHGSAAFLAANGYAALAIDLIGGGERYLPAPDGACFAPNTGQHNILGPQLDLYGANLAWLLLTDCAAGVSALQAQPEVDPARIGMTGASGGGWATFFTAAVDDRVTAAAPVASVNSFAVQTFPGDAEQSFFDAIARGLDYPDLAAFLIAPRPLFVVANTGDIWSLDATEYTVAEARRAYRLPGREDALRYRSWEGGHQCTADQWETIARWFNDTLGNTAPWAPLEADRDLPSTEETRVSRSGNLYLDGEKTPRQIMLRQLDGGEQYADPIGWLRERIGPPPEAVPWETIDAFPAGDVEGRRIIFSPEPGLWLPAEVRLPAEPRGTAILLDEIDRREGREWIMEAAAKGYAALRPDLRGWGETAPAPSWEEWENFVQTLFNGQRAQLAAMAHLVGRDIVLDRARDARALISAAGAMGLPAPVILHGRRAAATVALLAALTDSRVAELSLEYYLESYAGALARDLHTLCPDEFVHGLLRHAADLPALRARFAGKLTLAHPLDACQQPRDRAVVKRSAGD